MVKWLDLVWESKICWGRCLPYLGEISDIDDQVQQENWIRETGKLWQQATSKNETFEFLTIEDIIEENFKCKQENDQLRDIIDN